MTMFTFFVSLFAIGYILSSISTPGKAGEKRKKEQEREKEKEKDRVFVFVGGVELGGRFGK